MNNQNIIEFETDFLESMKQETPYFLFSKKKIEENYHMYKRFFPMATIQYAMKANSELEILEILDNLGSGFEVASKYELEILKKLKIAPDKIVYGTSVKPQ